MLVRGDAPPKAEFRERQSYAVAREGGSFRRESRFAPGCWYLGDKHSPRVFEMGRPSRTAAPAGATAEPREQESPWLLIAFAFLGRPRAEPDALPVPGAGQVMSLVKRRAASAKRAHGKAYAARPWWFASGDAGGLAVALALPL